MIGTVPSILIHYLTGSFGYVYAFGSLAYVIWMSGFVLPQKLENEQLDTLLNLAILASFGTPVLFAFLG